jgi:hypothetical protein
MGIGSEGYQSVKLKRKFIGIELKEAYWKQACKYISNVSDQSETLFDLEAAE